MTCGSGVGGRSRERGGEHRGIGLNGVAGAAQQHCPDYVPYSAVFPGATAAHRLPARSSPEPGSWICVPRAAPKPSPPACSGSPPDKVPGPPPPDPATVGAQAASELQLPDPALALSPASDRLRQSRRMAVGRTVGLAPVRHRRGRRTTSADA